MPPKRTFSVAAAAPMTVVAVEQLIEARVSEKYSNMVELPHEDCYLRCCLCYGLEDTKEDHDSQMLPKG
ncbi:hypothetical protein Tco_1224986 [Tanacetum coccineum]